MDFNNLAAYAGTSDPGVASQARAEGFPAAPHLSHIPITRSSETASLNSAQPSQDSSLFVPQPANLPLPAQLPTTPALLEAAAEAADVAAASTQITPAATATAAVADIATVPHPAATAATAAAPLPPSSLGLSYSFGALSAAFGNAVAASSFGKRLQQASTTTTTTMGSSSSSSKALQSTAKSSVATSPGFNSIDSGRGTQALAVGPTHLLHAAGTVLAVYTLDPTTGNKTLDPPRRVQLSALFAPAADSCTGGVYDPNMVFDKLSNRFLISATCGGDGRVLLAMSSSSNALSSWVVLGLVADGVSTSLACTSPKESALVDYTKLTYNADGVYVSFFSYCPSNPSVSGSAILALPKYGVVKGMPNFFYAVYTSAEVVKALGNAAAADSLTASNSCRQLQPVVPRTARDIPTGSVTFLCEVSVTTVVTRFAVTLHSLWGN